MFGALAKKVFGSANDRRLKTYKPRIAACSLPTASITLRVYAHYLPSASHREVDRLDLPQPSATPAQPDAVSGDQPSDVSDCEERSEPRWNRTINPQIKSLLLCQLS